MSRTKQSIHLDSLFLDLQREMIARLNTNRTQITHPGTKGDATELDWINMFRVYFPKRYSVEKAIVIDNHGDLSEQIDIVIFDNQYSPFLFRRDGAVYVPSESVYAVLETKQDLNRSNLVYAAKKAASVRRLKRTSARITHAGGIYRPKPLHEIVSGIVALESSWSPTFGQPFTKVMKSLTRTQKIDLGCVLRAGSFEASYNNAGIAYEFSERDHSLLFFFFRLLRRLQIIGTVPAIDILEYMKSFK